MLVAFAPWFALSFHPPYGPAPRPFQDLSPAQELEFRKKGWDSNFLIFFISTHPRFNLTSRFRLERLATFIKLLFQWTRP